MQPINESWPGLARNVSWLGLAPNVSWPGLARPPGTLPGPASQVVGGRDKPGHDTKSMAHSGIPMAYWTKPTAHDPKPTAHDKKPIAGDTSSVVDDRTPVADDTQAMDRAPMHCAGISGVRRGRDETKA